MSAGEQGRVAARAWVWAGRELAWSAPSKLRSGFVARCMVAGLMALIFVMSATRLAIADVDTAGSLRQVPSTLKSRPGEVEPLFEKASGDYECYSYSDVQNAADSFVIGNCQAPWQIQVVSYSGPNGNGYHSYGGFVTGAFSGCGWIETRFEPKKLNSNKNSACGEGSTGDFEVPQSSFMEKHNSALGDGWPVVTTRACPEYANYRPWSSNNIEQGLIRTAPAYASSGPGSNYPALKWRYITKYESTDGTHRYVMVRDDRYNAGEGNWVFVPRSCLPSTLPENENERLPPPPVVTTDGASGVATPNATLNATVNPNGVDTQYFFEYGTTESYGSYTTAEDAGAGTSPVPVSAAIGGLASGTTYYFRIVASSAIGEVFGGPVAFTTQPPPVVSTGSASGVQQSQAQLNGNVNPEGLGTYYHFVYGTTTSYGLSTTEGYAGAGTSGVPVGVTATGLEPGTTYHYRIVASSSAGTSEGEDETFTTRVEPNVFFADAKHGDTMTDRWENPSGWLQTSFEGDEIAKGSSPFALMVNGEANIFFIDGSHGNTLTDRWNSVALGSWTQTILLGDEIAKGTAPSAIMVGHEPNVFFVDASKGNTLTDRWFNPSLGWTQTNFGGNEIAKGTSPSAVMVGNEANIFFVDASKGNTLTDRWYNPTLGWSQTNFGGDEVAKGTSPSAMMVNGEANVFFVDASKGNTLTDRWDSVALGGWTQTNLGGDEVAKSTSPSALMVNGEANVFFVDASKGNTLTDRWDSVALGGWTQTNLGGDEVAKSTSPSALMYGPEANIFFVDASKGNTLTDRWDSVALGGWTQTNLGGDEVAGESSPSALGV